nr:hypothetical protein [Fodinicola feengrottensis]
MPPQLRPWAQTLDLTRLDDELALAVRKLITRARDLRVPALRQLEAELVAEVAAVTAPPPPVGTPPAIFLVCVLAERRRRTLQRSAERKAAAAQLAVIAPAAPVQPATVAVPSGDLADWTRPASEVAAAPATGFARRPRRGPKPQLDARRRWLATRTRVAHFDEQNLRGPPLPALTYGRSQSGAAHCPPGGVWC